MTAGFFHVAIADVAAKVVASGCNRGDWDMTNDEMRDRVMDFAVRVLRMAESLPRTVSGQTIARQVARSGTSVAANYRAALRGKSRPDFINKIAISLEEADETGFWIDLAERARLVRLEEIAPLRQETHELVRILSATRSTARKNSQS
jgi:four helix bundle protein